MTRDDQWKYVWRHPDGPNELYDMATDPGERHNCAGDPASAAIEAQQRARIAAFFERYADPQYDLWRGGRSKAGRLVP